MSLSQPAHAGLTHPTPPRTSFASDSEYFRAPQLPMGARYALWPRFESSVLPFAFPSLDALARHIHRRRDGAGIALSPEAGSFRDGRRPVVRVDALGADGERQWLIGYAFLEGRPREALEAALRANEPDAEA